MSEPKPGWFTVTEPDTNWDEAAAARFDGVPLDPDQATPERVLALAVAAIAAADDIETVLRLWPFPGYSLKNLRRLAQELN